MKKEDLGRLFSVLESDRRNASMRFDKLISCDIAAVLKEYFVISGAVKVGVNFDQNGYHIVIRAHADRLIAADALKNALFS